MPAAARNLALHLTSSTPKCDSLLFRSPWELLEEMKEPYRKLIEKLAEAITKKYGDRFISLVIFGSVAREEER